MCLPSNIVHIVHLSIKSSKPYGKSLRAVIATLLIGNGVLLSLFPSYCSLHKTLLMTRIEILLLFSSGIVPSIQGTTIM